jgi:hypothetical protein
MLAIAAVAGGCRGAHGYGAQRAAGTCPCPILGAAVVGNAAAHQPEAHIGRGGVRARPGMAPYSAFFSLPSNEGYNTKFHKIAKMLYASLCAWLVYALVCGVERIMASLCLCR